MVDEGNLICSYTWLIRVKFRTVQYISVVRDLNSAQIIDRACDMSYTKTRMSTMGFFVDDIRYSIQNITRILSPYSDLLLTERLRGQSSSPGRVKNFLFFVSSRLALGPTQPPLQWVPRTLSPGVRRLGREADHSPSTNAEVKKICIYTSTPPCAFMV
jgi:hypothetical protein